MGRLLIHNGRVVDPSQGLDRIVNLLIEDGRIADVDVEASGDCQVLDATDCIVATGLVDRQVELRESACEEDRANESWTAAAREPSPCGA